MIICLRNDLKFSVINITTVLHTSTSTIVSASSERIEAKLTSARHIYTYGCLFRDGSLTAGISFPKKMYGVFISLALDASTFLLVLGSTEKRL